MPSVNCHKARPVLSVKLRFTWNCVFRPRTAGDVSKVHCACRSMLELGQRLNRIHFVKRIFVNSSWFGGRDPIRQFSEERAGRSGAPRKFDFPSELAR